jgi:hypothetical protein
MLQDQEEKRFMNIATEHVVKLYQAGLYRCTKYSNCNLDMHISCTVLFTLLMTGSQQSFVVLLIIFAYLREPG